MINLKIIDSVTFEIIQGKDLVKKILSYKAEYWKQGAYCKERIEYDKSFVTGKYCYNGFIPRIRKYCEDRNIPFACDGDIDIIKPVRKPKLKDIKFRDIQLESIKQINDKQTGVINLSTGIGKTIFAAGLISTYKNPKVLFICRSNDLVNQAYETFNSFGFKCCKIGNGKKVIDSPIVCGTVQTYKNLDLIKYCSYFDILIVDEIHKGMNIGGQYEKVLSKVLAPIRVGLTGTIPKKIGNAMLIEGLIGEVVVKADTVYGIKENILMKPKIEYIIYPLAKSISKYSTYKELYNHGIVENTARNNAICKEIKKEVEDKNSSIIFCVEIKHIENISRILTEKGIIHKCVYGDIDVDERIKIKKDLINKKYYAVISSVVWVEGLDIPSLNCIFNISGGKSNEALLQKIGRVLRTSENKKECKVYEVLDPGKYLADHTIKRLTVLKQNDII
ncbi:DEAD/DEAH box helicase family protein [Lutibacter sp.]|uniref:DEAD/DEAH box helicase n=1 Tax=Lutibacter sp. TaxID=1925666 RepID=UPI0025C0C441|nr:DEAD/DEAH box helicase family protein [Lutibacter sp.]